MLFPSIYGRALLNIAQLNFVHGNDQTSLYLKALEILPNDLWIRLQTSASLSRTSNIDAAISILLPIPTKLLDVYTTRVVMGILVDANYQSEAIQLYESLKQPIVFNPSIAVFILNSYVTIQKQIPPDKASNLLVQAFGLDPLMPEFQSLLAKVKSPAFSQDELALRLRESSVSWHRESQSLTELMKLKNPPIPSVPDLTYISALLNITPANLKLGNELIINGDFTQYNSISGSPEGWTRSFMSTGSPWNLGAFVSDVDAGALRIDGLLIERHPQREYARAGFWLSNPITVTAFTPYVITFLYRTQDVIYEPNVTFWLSQDADVLITHDYMLPATNGDWKRVIVIAWNRSDKEATIKPLLHLWSEGSAWFDNFSVRPLFLKTPIAAREAIVDIHNLE